MANLPVPYDSSIGVSQYFDPLIAQFPELANAKSPTGPVRVGVDRKTGKVIMGWAHTEQSIATIFATPFHERVLRRYVGSFVPHILGESGVPAIITRFFWAMASAIDLWEPNYRIKRVHFMNYAVEGPTAATTGAEQLRQGHAVFRQEGVHRPRAHLGDNAPEMQRSVGLVDRGGNYWDVVPTAPGG